MVWQGAGLQLKTMQEVTWDLQPWRRLDEGVEAHGRGSWWSGLISA